MSVRHWGLWGGGLAAVGVLLLLLVFKDPAFSPRSKVFSATALSVPKTLEAEQSIRLVHFWDPACPCNVGNQAHLLAIVQQFAPQGVRFYSVKRAGRRGQLPAVFSAVKPLEEEHNWAPIPASPAVAIWNAQGDLVYFGPYTEGANCNVTRGFVEPILEATLAGRSVQATHQLAVACFCDWN